MSSLKRSRLVAHVALALCAPMCARAFAQQPTRACAETLALPTRDSIPLAVGMRIHAFDRSADLPESYQQLFAEGVRTFLKVPSPLAIQTYETQRDMSGVERVAHLTLSGAYRATLRRNGRIENMRATGGARTGAFDQALYDALRVLDTSGFLPPVPDSAGADSIPIALTLLTNDARTRLLDGVEVPLFAFRTPLRPVTKPATQVGGIFRVTYPRSLRERGIAGEVILSFVVRPEGVPDTETLHAWKVDHFEFLEAVVGAMPKFVYQPMELEGCKVPQLVREPFRFTLDP